MAVGKENKAVAPEFVKKQPCQDNTAGLKSADFNLSMSGGIRAILEWFFYLKANAQDY